MALMVMPQGSTRCMAVAAEAITHFILASHNDGGPPTRIFAIAELEVNRRAKELHTLILN